MDGDDESRYLPKEIVILIHLSDIYVDVKICRNVNWLSYNFDLKLFLRIALD